LANDVAGNQFKSTLKEGGQKLGIRLSPELLERYDRYYRLLLEWNRRFNLTSLTGEAEAAIKLFLDSLAPLPYLPARGSLLDIGSGAGFPGIPLKMARPELTVHLAEASRKKASFQKQVILELGLGEIYVHHVRLIPHRGHELSNEGFDAVISRAVGSIKDLVAIGGRYLSKEGVLISMKGPKVKEEILHPAYADFRIEKVIEYTLPLFDLPRSLALIYRVARSR
jgi:16S rRNA (guanine527-N7)-methyltransferase